MSEIPSPMPPVIAALNSDDLRGRGCGRWRRVFGSLARALVGGLLATVTSSAVGGLWFALMAVALDAPSGAMAAPGIVMIGLVFGPLYALPVTLGVLPALWLVVRRFAPGRVGPMMLLCGPLAGAIHLWRILPRDDETSVMGWVFLGAGTAGGLAAGLTFRLLTERLATGKNKGQS